MIFRLILNSEFALSGFQTKRSGSQQVNLTCAWDPIENQNSLSSQLPKKKKLGPWWALNLGTRYGNEVLITLLWRVSIDYNMDVQYQRGTLQTKVVCLCRPIGRSLTVISHNSAATVVRTRPLAITIAMITLRKSSNGFPLLSYMSMGLRLVALQLRYKLNLLDKRGEQCLAYCFVVSNSRLVFMEHNISSTTTTTECS